MKDEAVSRSCTTAIRGSESGRPLKLRLPGRRLRRLLFRLGILALSTILSLTIAEWGVRVFEPQVLFPRYVTDGGFGIRGNVPNARYWHTSPEMRVQFRINSMHIIQKFLIFYNVQADHQQGII